MPTIIPQVKSCATAWLFAFFIISSVFLSCGTESSERIVATAPFMPIQLQSDTTVIYLQDFLPLHLQLDSVKWEDGSTLIIDSIDHEPVVRITQQPMRSIGFLQLWSGSIHSEIPLFKTSKQRVRLSVNSIAPSEQVDVIGTFTNWQGNPLRMQPSNEAFTLELMLDPGVHFYQLVIDGVEQPDPSNPRMVPNGFGGWNSVLEVDKQGAPLPLDINFMSADQIESQDGVRRSDQLIAQTRPGAYYYAWWDNEIYGFGMADSNGFFQLSLPAIAYQMERSHLRLWACTSVSKSQESLIPLSTGIPITQSEALSRFDRQAMVMYFLMVDRFKNGDPSNDWSSNDPGVLPEANHFGGDLAGVQQAIPYIDSLGANTIWVSPIAPNPDGAWGYWSDPRTEITSKFSSYHGYWPIASTGVDRRFGTMKSFNNLVDDVHANGQNILVDYVANHVHEEHPIYTAHPEWVTNLYLPDSTLNTQLWDEQRLTTWFDTFMPTLDLENPEVYEVMTDSAAWWVENTDIDGFRHDATKHIPEVFWRTLTRKIREREHTPTFQIGETYGSPDLIRSYLSNGMLDAQFDFNLYDALVSVFTGDSADIPSLIDVANQSLATYGSHHLMGIITGNQDRPRFASMADGSLDPGEDTKFAGWTREIQHNGNTGYRKMSWLMTFLMSSPGIPCIYYGDEIADAGGNDPDNRRMMRFDQWNEEEQWMWNWTQKWISLRKSRMSLMYGTTEYREIAPGLLAIHRTYLNENTWVLINTTGNSFEITVDTDDPLRPLIGSLKTLKDGQLTLKAWGCAAFDVQPRLVATAH